MALRTLSVALMVALAISPDALAADLWWDVSGATPGVGGTGTWEDGQGNWSTNVEGTSPTNWANATPPVDTAIFDGAPGTVTVSGTVNALGLSFGTGGYILEGGPILTSANVAVDYTLGSGTTVLSNDMIRYRANSAANNATLNIYNRIPGTLEINGDFSYVGGTGVVTGTNSINFSATTADSVIVVNGSLTGDGFVSGGGLRFNNDVGVDPSLGTVIVNNDNTGFSSVRMNGGTMLLGNALALGTSGTNFGDNTFSSRPMMRMLTNGALTIQNNITYGAHATIPTTRVLGGNTADVSTFTGNLTLTGAAMTPVLTAAAGGRVNFTGAISSDAGPAIRIGENDSATGIVALDRALGIAATRGVNVDFGTLLILNATGTNSNTGSGGVAVASEAILGGTGRAGGLVTALAADSGFSPGDIDAGGDSQIGTLWLRGGLTAATGATFAIDIDGALVDIVNFGAGPLSLDGTVTFDFSDLGDVNLDSPYVLFAGTGDWSGLPTFEFNTPGSFMLDPSYGTGGYVWDTEDNELSVQFAVVPEPASLALVLIGGVGGLLMVTRRKHGQK